MAFEKDQRGKELVDAVVAHAEDIVEQGYSREVAISQSINKFGVSRDILEKKIPFFEGGKASDKKMKVWEKKKESVKGIQEMEMGKADGTKILVTR